MKEIVIDYDSVTETALLYSVDYTGGVGTLVPAEIADAPGLVSGAEMVDVRSLLGLYQLVDETDFIYPTRHMTFTLPEGGDKCTNVYGVTGALRDRYIRRCIGVEMRYHTPFAMGGDAVIIDLDDIIPREEVDVDTETCESLMIALTAALPDSILITSVFLSGCNSRIKISTLAERERLLRIYMGYADGTKPPLVLDALRSLAEESILDCVRANVAHLLEREDYTNDKAKELIRRYTTTATSNE